MAMGEIATRQLTDMQAEFVRRMADSGNGPDSALSAGYRQSAPASAAAELLRTPHVLAALQSEVRRRIVSLAPMALGVVESIALNDDISPKVRLDAAKILLERSGHVAPKAAAERQADAPLHEMTTEQLRELAGRLEDEIAGRAKDVSSAALAPSATQDTDIIG